MSAGAMVGLDPESLEAAANQLDQTAKDLDDARGNLGGMLKSLSWLGGVAVAFFDLWDGQHNKRMVVTADYLREAAGELRHQAREQRDASRGDDAAWAAQGRSMTELWHHDPRLRAIAGDLADDIRRVRDLSTAEQLAWWNSLTPEQRMALLYVRPGELTALHGLPPEVLLQAQQNYTTLIAGRITTISMSATAEFGVKVMGIGVGVSVEAEWSVNRDGTVELSVDYGAEAGGKAGDIKLLRELGLGGTFEFANMAEAERWMRDLETALKEGNLVEFLQQSGEHLASVHVSDGISAGVGVAAGVGVGAAIAANVSQSVDVSGEGKGDVTLSARGSFSASADGGSFGLSGSVDGKVSATFHGTTPTSISFEASFHGSKLDGIFSSIGSVGQGEGMSGTAQITLDLTRPELQGIAPQLAAAMTRGDLAEVARLATSVIDQAEITVQTFNTSTTTAGFDAEVVKAQVTTTTSVAASTYVKPPSGSFYKVD